MPGWTVAFHADIGIGAKGGAGFPGGSRSPAGGAMALGDIVATKLGNGDGLRRCLDGWHLRVVRAKPAAVAVLDDAFDLIRRRLMPCRRLESKRRARERGELSRIPLIWNDATRMLTIGARLGSFPGMLAERSFQAVLVSRERPVGFSFTLTTELPGS